MSTIPASPGSLTTGNRIDRKLVRGRVRYERSNIAGVGTVFFHRSGGVLRDMQEHELLVPESVGPITLSTPLAGQPETGGEFAEWLPVNDDPNVQPQNTQWTAEFNVTGATEAQFPPITFTLSVDDPETVWIDVKVTSPPLTPSLQFVLSGDPRLLPAGGLTGQALVKLSNDDYDYGFGAAGGPGGGGTAALTSFDNTDPAAIAAGIGSNNLQLAVVEVAAERVTHAQTLRVVNTGGNVDFARPVGVGAVWWIHSGSTRPNNMILGVDGWNGMPPPLGSITVAMLAADFVLPANKVSLPVDSTTAATPSLRSTADGSAGSSPGKMPPWDLYTAGMLAGAIPVRTAGGGMTGLAPGAAGRHLGVSAAGGLEYVDSVRVVDHGTNPDFPRPAAKIVIWTGTVFPNLSLPTDLWLNPDEFDQTSEFGPELRQFRTALAMVDTTPCNILLLGDSVAAGANADAPPAGYTGTLGPGRYSEVLLRRLQQAHGTGKSVVYKPVRYNFAPGNGMHWTHNSAASPNGITGNEDGGLGRFQLNLGASLNNWIETVEECDSFDVFYAEGFLGNTGSFNVIVDGVVIDTFAIPGTGARSMPRRYNVAPGRHTIRIQTAVTAQFVLIQGAIFYNGDSASGVRLYDSAHGGQKTGYFADLSAGAYGTLGSKMYWLDAVTRITPSLVIYHMGLNDYTDNTPTATIKANINTTLDAVRTALGYRPSELIIIPHAHAFDLLPTYPEHTEAQWLAYRKAFYEVAQDRGAAILDSYDLMGYAKESSDLSDLFSADEIHPNERGHRVLGHALADKLLGRTTTERGNVRQIWPSSAGTKTPPAGFADVHAYPYAGRPLLEAQPAVGYPAVAGFPWARTYASDVPGSAGLNHMGVGALSGLLGSQSLSLPTGLSPYAIEYVTAATLNNQAGIGDTDKPWWIGPHKLAFNAGFFFVALVSLGSLAAERVFVGLSDLATGFQVGTTDPGGHHIGFVYHSGTPNWQVSSRDGTANTKTTTRVPVTAGDPFELILWVPAGGTGVGWQIRNLGAISGDTTGNPNRQQDSGTKTDRLPTTQMRRVWVAQTTEAVAKTLRVMRAYIESDH